MHDDNSMQLQINPLTIDVVMYAPVLGRCYVQEVHGEAQVSGSLHSTGPGDMEGDRPRDCHYGMPGICYRYSPAYLSDRSPHPFCA